MDVVEKGDPFGAPQKIKVKKARRTRNEIFLQEAMYGPPRQCKNCGQIIRLADGRTKCNWLGYDQGSASDINPEYVCKYWKAPARDTIGKLAATSEKKIDPEIDFLPPETPDIAMVEERGAIVEVDMKNLEPLPETVRDEILAPPIADDTEEDDHPALEQMRRELEMPPMGDLF